MPASQVIKYDNSTVKLALLDALTAGLALGYLAHQNRETLVIHSAVIGLSALVLAAAVVVLRTFVRVLRRETRRVEAIFADELAGRPDRRDP